MLDGTTSAKLLPVEPLTSPVPAAPKTMPAIWLVVLVGLLAVPAVPVLPLLVTIEPAVVMPLVVPVGCVGSQTEYVPAARLEKR